MAGLAPRPPPRGAAENDREPCDGEEENPREIPDDLGAEMPRDGPTLRGTLPEDRGTEIPGDRPEEPRRAVGERVAIRGVAERVIVCGARPAESDGLAPRVTVERGTLTDDRGTVTVDRLGARGTLTDDRGTVTVDRVGARGTLIDDRGTVTVDRGVVSDDLGILAEAVPLWLTVPRSIVLRGMLADAVPPRATAPRSNVPRGILADATPLRATVPRANVSRGMLGEAVRPRAQSVATLLGMLGEV
jgi:hypothetical protein